MLSATAVEMRITLAIAQQIPILLSTTILSRQLVELRVPSYLGRK